MDNNLMFALAERLKALRGSKKDTEAQIKAINEDIEITESQLAAIMLDTETQNFTRNGTMFCLTSTIRASAVAGRKDELFTALKTKGYGTLVTETVNANSLAAFVREQMAENTNELPQWLEGLVNPYEKTGVSVRRSTKQQ